MHGGTIYAPHRQKSKRASSTRHKTGKVGIWRKRNENGKQEGIKINPDSERYMTDYDIRMSYKQAKHPTKQIKVLAELNDMSRNEIRAILGLQPKEDKQNKNAKEVRKNEQG